MKRMYAALNSIEIRQVEAGQPEWHCLIPARRVIGRDGRWWENSSPQSVVDFVTQLGRDLPIDIEHSSEHKAPYGDPAPAVGWVRELEDRKGEIWGRIEWNASGKQLVDDKAYRYLSPVIIYRQDDRVIVGMTSVGMTNQPNLHLPALNHQEGADDAPKESIMLRALLAALALPEAATEAEAVAKVKELQGNLASANNRAENPSLEKFVPRGDYDAALTRATNAEQALKAEKDHKLETAINAAIETALKDGKITPATADYHKAQCRQEGGLDRFTAYCAAAPVIAGASGLDGKKPEGETKALNAQEKEILANLDISEEEYAKTAA